MAGEDPAAVGEEEELLGVRVWQCESGNNISTIIREKIGNVLLVKWNEMRESCV